VDREIGSNILIAKMQIESASMQSELAESQEDLTETENNDIDS